MENIISTYPFRIVEGVYPDLINNRFYINLANVGFNILIVEQWATGNLYATIENSSYQIPLRYNTNLLPSSITGYTLYYNFDKQMFIFSEMV